MNTSSPVASSLRTHHTCPKQSKDTCHNRGAPKFFFRGSSLSRFSGCARRGRSYSAWCGVDQTTSVEELLCAPRRMASKRMMISARLCASQEPSSTSTHPLLTERKRSFSTSNRKTRALVTTADAASVAKNTPGSSAIQATLPERKAMSPDLGPPVAPDDRHLAGMGLRGRTQTGGQSSGVVRCGGWFVGHRGRGGRGGPTATNSPC